VTGRLPRVWAALLLACALPAQGQFVDPSRNWRTFDTDHYTVHFAEAHRAQAQVVAGIAETVHARVTAWLQWQPESRTHLVVLDSADFANGYASPLPFNNTAIFLSPPDDGELLQNREWLDLVLTHEITHVVHLDLARRAPLVLRRIFGRAPPWLLIFPNTLPNVWGPNWVKEGLATYAESDAARGWGRLGQSAFEGMMRAEVARGPISLREIHADGRGFPHNRNYLYGAYFFLFLTERYGPRAITSLVENYSDDFIPFRVHTNPVVATRKTMDVLWVEYQDWLIARFAPSAGETAPRRDEAGEIIARSFSLTSPVLTRAGERWYVRSDGYTKPRLVRQSKGGEVEAVRDVERDARLAAPESGGLVVAQPEICDDYNYYYDLYQVGPDGGWDRLTRCGRFRFAAPLDDGRIAAVRVDRGQGEVVVLDRKGAVERSLYRAAPGESLTGLTARGAAVALTSLRDGRWSLIEIADGRSTVLASDPAIKHSPRYAASADEIYFVANYGNSYDVWSWRRGERLLARWTRSMTGVREMSAPVAGEMLLATIEADGDVLRAYRLPDSPLERREAAVAAVEVAVPAVADDARRSAERPYSPWSSLLPRSWFPVFYVDDGAVAAGVTTFGQDALGLHQYSVTPMYEFTQGETLGSFIYEYNQRHRLLLDRRMSVKASTKKEDEDAVIDREVQRYTVTDSVQWVSTWRSLSLNTRFYWGLGGAIDREKLHDVNAATTSIDNERVLALVGGVDTRRSQWLSEGPSQGQQLRLFYETSNGLAGDYSGNVYRGDWRVYLPLRKTVVALRWNEVYGQADAEPIELGGTGTNEALALPVLNVREFPLRGYRSGEPVLTGHRARLGSIELRIPLSDIDRHFMVPPVGLNRVSMSVFFDIGAAWDKGESPDYFRGTGVEFLLEPRFGYLFGLQARAGVARGLDGPGETKWYLRVGRSF
jgi:hypothetical protein